MTTLVGMTPSNEGKRETNGRLKSACRRHRGSRDFDGVPGVLHGFGEFLGGEGVEDVVFGEPGAAGLQNAVANFFHVGGVVGVGVDDDLYALLFGLAEMRVV